MRIYVPLVLCLVVALTVQAIVGSADVTKHTILDFLGLTGFFSLLNVTHTGSVGRGLWFVTAIVAMYLLLPLLRRLFGHRHGLAHLIIVVVLCITANWIFYTDENWNVVIAFCVGTYLAVNDKLEATLQRPVWQCGLAGAILLLICGLATFRLIPRWTRLLLFPFYPLGFVLTLVFASIVYLVDSRLRRWIEAYFLREKIPS